MATPVSDSRYALPRRFSSNNIKITMSAFFLDGSSSFPPVPWFFLRATSSSSYFRLERLTLTARVGRIKKLSFSPDLSAHTFFLSRALPRSSSRAPRGTGASGEWVFIDRRLPISLWPQPHFLFFSAFDCLLLPSRARPLFCQRGLSRMNLFPSGDRPPSTPFLPTFLQTDPYGLFRSP